MHNRSRQSSWSTFGLGVVTGVSLLAAAFAYRRIMEGDDLSAFGCQ